MAGPKFNKGDLIARGQLGMANDYYEILGVSRNSSEDEIRNVYRKLAHIYHPDKTGGDKAAEAKIKEINEAFDVLKNKL